VPSSCIETQIEHTCQTTIFVHSTDDIESVDQLPLAYYLHVADEQAKQHQPKNADDDCEGDFTDEQARRQILA
jgi:hypothetical protein